jgi:two-component system LytT family response regulator
MKSKGIPKALELNPEIESASSQQLKDFITDAQLLNTEIIPDEIFQIVKASHQAFYEYFSKQRIFMVATATGFHVLRSEEISYFEYIKERKQWAAVLTNKSILHLKRNTKADDILLYSLKFVRINQQMIVNIDYLQKIEGNLCRLSISNENEERLIISRSYLKALQERVEVI